MSADDQLDECGYPEGTVHPHVEQCHRAERATVLREMTGDLDELERLRRWKAEAAPLFDGLQDLGRALGLPLGVLVTGPAAVEAAEALRAERDAARVHNHPPYRPACNEREVDGRLRGACVNDDGSDR